MNQSFYTGAVGASQHQSRMNVHSDNIANVNTYGFKTQKASFSSLMYSGIRSIEGEEALVGTGARLQMTTTDFSQGGVVTTGLAQDYMIEGDGFFALVDLRTNAVTFTRNGAFCLAEYQKVTEEVDENGEPVIETVFCLSDGEGRFVLSDQGEMIEVTDPNAAQSVGVFDYNNYDGMLREGESQFLPVDKNGTLRLGSGEVVQGALELSNVDLAQELTKVIEAQRAYQMALKMVQTSDEIETTINNLR